MLIWPERTGFRQWGRGMKEGSVMLTDFASVHARRTARQEDCDVFGRARGAQTCSLDPMGTSCHSKLGKHLRRRTVNIYQVL